MSDCTHDCSTCGSNCSSRKKDSLIKSPHRRSHIKRVIAVASGKGGVGKSLVTALLAARSAARGFRTAIIDADITGPSIPKMFGVTDRATGTDGNIRPVTAKGGIKLISMNTLLDHDDDPVVWRGALIAGACLQFWTDVIWDDVDIMFIDMPPGTGDVPLSVFQSIPISGTVIVMTPQELVEMIVGKALNMTKMMKIPVLGLVENMSYFSCPDCGKRVELFGKSKVEELAKKYNFPATAKLPLDPAIAALADEGNILSADTDPLQDIFLQIEKSREIKG